MIINKDGVRIVEESDLINEDQPHYFTYAKDEKGTYIFSPRFNFRFYLNDCPMTIDSIVDGLNNGNIKLDIKI